MKKIRTVKDEKKRIRKNLKKGCICACCGRKARISKSSLNASKMTALLALYRIAKEKGINAYYHIDEISNEIGDVPQCLKGGEWSKLRHFGFIEQAIGSHENGSKRNGYYRLLKKGILFLKGEITAPKSVYLYNKTIKGFSKENIDIEDASGK